MTKRLSKIYILSASGLWATAPIIIKLLSSKLDVLSIVTLRFFFAFLIAWLFIGIFRKKILPFQVSFIDLDVIIPGILGIGVGFGAYAYSIVDDGVINATFVFYTYPIIMSIYNKKVRNQLSRRKIFGLVIAMIGVFIIQYQNVTLGNNFSILSFLLPLIAAITWAYYSISIRDRLAENMDVQFMSYLPGIISLFVFVIFFHRKEISHQFTNLEIHEYFTLLFLGIISTTLAFWLYFIAIKDSIDASILVISYSTPIYVTVYNFIIFKEIITNNQVVGGIFIGYGIYLSQKNIISNT